MTCTLRVPVLAALALVLAGPVRAQVPVARELASPAPESNAQFAVAVAGVPDVDGDGRGDVLVGVPLASAAGTQPGRAFVYSGATGALLYGLVSPAPEVGGRFGVAVAGVPDVDGDGRGDLLVGTEGERLTTGGRAYVYSGATGALLRTLASPAGAPSGYFGRAVAGVPDVNGDGRGDLLVGAYGEPVVTTQIDVAGRAYLFSGATGVLLRSLTTPAPVAFAGFGYSVASVPDADGDGRSDLLVGAYGETDGTLTEAGRAYLFSSASGVLLRAFASPAPERSGNFGWDVAGVPDADGDGRGDVLVGALREDGGDTDAGRAYLFSGATGARLRTLFSAQPGASGAFGGSVAGVADQDGDGRGDVLVGAYGERTAAGAFAGRASLISGATGALIRTLTSPNGEAAGFFARDAVAAVPDADGDGRADLLVGAYGEGTAAGRNDGRAYLYNSRAAAAAEPGLALGGLALLAPRPNPASGRVRLGYEVATAGPARLTLTDVLGREVAVLADAERAAGLYEATLDTARLAPGVYALRLVTPSGAVVRRLTVAR